MIACRINHWGMRGNSGDAIIWARAPPDSTTCYIPNSSRRHTFFIKTKRYWIVLKEKNDTPSPPPHSSRGEPAPPGPGGPALAAGGGAEIFRAKRKATAANEVVGAYKHTPGILDAPN